jgi:hypothetical protein
LHQNENARFNPKDSTIFSQLIHRREGIKLIETKKIFSYNDDIDRLYYYY